MMVEFGTILFTAGVNLVGKLLFKWISEGKSAVRTSTIDREIAIEAERESAQRRLRADDLESASQKALQEIVARSPQLSFAKSGLRPSSLRLDFDPKDPKSSKDLLLALRRRIDEIDRDALNAGQGPQVVLPPGAVLAPAETSTGPDGGLPPTPPTISPGKQMLDNLKARVDRMETERE